MSDFSRRTFLAAAGAPLLATQSSKRPNILLLITDQQAQAALGASGNPYLQTPAMDSLARDGVSFSESYCTYPVCSPARSSLLTGRMPHETGVRVNGLPIAADIPNLGQLFGEAGYRAVYAGKWHLPKPFGGVTGFEELIGGGGLGAQMDEPLASACVKFLTSRPPEPLLLVASFMNPHDICSWIRAHPGSRAHPGAAEYPPPPANMAVDPDEPEYLQFHRTGDYNLMSNAVKIASEWKRDDVRHYVHSYYRLVEKVDRQIGRVISALRMTGLFDRTLTVFTSDHGEGMGAHLWAQKAAFWEETAKVPLIVAAAGLQRRGILDERSLVSGLDVLPTVCDYAGISPPRLVRGKSLRSEIEGSGSGHDFVVSELSEYGAAERQGRMLRSSRYKYVAFDGGARPEQLFDLQLDPGEVYNLAERPEHAAELRRHRDLLTRWIEKTVDDFRLPPSIAS